MRHASRPMVLLIVSLSIGGCGDRPSDVFDRLQEAAKRGKVEEFGSYFTEESRPFAEALLLLYKTQHNPEIGIPQPLEVLALAKVKSEKVQNQRGVVTVEAAGRTYRLVFRKEGDWKLDLKLTERENSQAGF